MNTKFFMIFTLLSSCTYLYKDKISSSKTYIKSIEKIDDDVKNLKSSFRIFLEGQLENEVTPAKTLAEYSFKDMLKILRREPKVEELSLLQLLENVAVQNMKRSMNIVSGFLNDERNMDFNDYFTILVIVMIASRFEAAVFYLVSRAITGISTTINKTTKSIYNFLKLVVFKTIFAPILFAFRKIFPRKKPSINSDKAPIAMVDVATAEDKNCTTPLTGKSPENKSLKVAAPKKVYVSKLRKCDGRKIWGFKMMMNHLIYVYAEESLSKLPRLNPMKEELH